MYWWNKYQYLFTYKIHILKPSMTLEIISCYKNTLCLNLTGKYIIGYSSFAKDNNAIIMTVLCGPIKPRKRSCFFINWLFLM